MKMFKKLIIFIFLLFTISFSANANENSKITVGNARFTVLTPECIRMEYSKKEKFIDVKTLFAVNRDKYCKEFKHWTEGGKTIIETKNFKLVYNPDGKPFSSENLQVIIKKGKEEIRWTPGMVNQENLGGTIRTLDGIKGKVYLGEGLLSRDGWYLLDDSKTHILTSDWVARRPKYTEIDWYLFAYGYDYKAALKSMMTIGGIVPMPRKYALGSWYSRYWPYTSEEYCEIVKEYQQHNFPLDIMVLDMDWHREGWTGWSINRTLLPDFEELLKWFHKQKIFVTLNVHPADGVGPHEDMYEKFMKDMGVDFSTKQTIPYDAGNKKYIDTLFKHTHIPFEKLGVDFWWLDWQQYEFTRSIPHLSNLTWLNHYYYQHTSRDNKRGLSFSRWGGWGDHKHPIHFSGDADTGWEMLEFEVPFTSTAGNIGCFFWSHDIGGHMGTRNEESYTRWVQFAATSAALRLHSTRSKDLDKRPWKYSKQAEDSIRISFHLRSILFPYIYSSVWQSHKESIPLNRPMYIEYPEKEKSYHNAQQYFFGDTFLVAPITSPGIGPNKLALQTVWFPEGTWYNWFTGEKYTGGKEILVTADINEFPLYAKGGIPIPMQPYTQRMTTTPLNQLVIRCYPGDDGKEGNYTLYEDDGITCDYLKGKYAITNLSYTRKENTVTVVISSVKGKYKGQVKSRSYIIELPCTYKATSVKIDGTPCVSEYDENTFTNRIIVPNRAINKGFTINIEVKEVDFNTLKEIANLQRVKGLLRDIPTNSSLQDIIVKYVKNNPEPDILEALLAISGIALRKKNEGVYLYKGKERFYLYNDSDIVEDNNFNVTVINKIGKEKKKIFAKKYHINKFSSPALLEFTEEDLPAPPLGLSNLLTFEVNFKIKGEPVSTSYTITQKNSYLKQWNIAGSFKFNRDKKLSEQKYGPEKEKIDLSTKYKEADGKDICWQKAYCGESNIVDLKNYYNSDNSIAYGVTYLKSKKKQQVIFEINSDDGIEMWVNREKIHSNDIMRPIVHEPDKATATLKPGINEVLAKTSQGGGEWAFKVAINSLYPVEESFSFSK